MTPYEHRDTQPLGDPWPFTGRADELDLVSRSVAAGPPAAVGGRPAAARATPQNEGGARAARGAP
ncbi:hypothetical protein, partial [Streptomyces mexicanus]|uniref:hypothetical protein n=1 Tax=Streptomyces mexicanus TaxID=178566 RepID=UPI0036468446